MILPLSEENHKSLKFSSHPLFFSLIMQCLWPVSSSATTDSHTAGTEALTALTSLALASPFTFPAITFISQMLSVFKYTPGACQSRFFFVSPPHLHLIFSLLPGLLSHDFKTANTFPWRGEHGMLHGSGSQGRREK